MSTPRTTCAEQQQQKNNNLLIAKVTAGRKSAPFLVLLQGAPERKIMCHERSDEMFILGKKKKRKRKRGLFALGQVNRPKRYHVNVSQEVKSDDHTANKHQY